MYLCKRIWYRYNVVILIKGNTVRIRDSTRCCKLRIQVLNNSLPLGNHPDIVKGLFLLYN